MDDWGTRDILDLIASIDLSDHVFLDLAAIFGPEPSEERIKMCMEHDKAHNPHNEPYHNKVPRRGVAEIKADLRYLFAHEMLAARNRSVKQLRNVPGSGRSHNSI